MKGGGGMHTQLHISQAVSYINKDELSLKSRSYLHVKPSRKSHVKQFPRNVLGRGNLVAIIIGSK